MTEPAQPGTAEPSSRADGRWYTDGLRFECTQCGACCSGEPGFVWVGREEIRAMAEELNLAIAEFQRRYVRVVDGDRSLTERPGGDCSLLDPDTRRCTVYAVRPIQCRTWPFWDSTLETADDWRDTCESCPGAGRGRLYAFDEIEVRRREKSV